MQLRIFDSAERDLEDGDYFRYAPNCLNILKSFSNSNLISSIL